MSGINPTKFNPCLCVKVGHSRSPLTIQELYKVISKDVDSAYVTDKKERDYKFNYFILLIVNIT